MPRRLRGGYMPNPTYTDLIEQEELLVSNFLLTYLYRYNQVNTLASVMFVCTSASPTSSVERTNHDIPNHSLDTISRVPPRSLTYQYLTQHRQHGTYSKDLITDRTSPVSISCVLQRRNRSLRGNIPSTSRHECQTPRMEDSHERW
jgi:hypothetical protein